MRHVKRHAVCTKDMWLSQPLNLSCVCVCVCVFLLERSKPEAILPHRFDGSRAPKASKSYYLPGMLSA
jgi:hypothetical protein